MNDSGQQHRFFARTENWQPSTHDKKTYKIELIGADRASPPRPRAACRIIGDPPGYRPSRSAWRTL